jgi:ABC-type polysaccharide/polyol phosphate transport system ATPase subunit
MSNDVHQKEIAISVENLHIWYRTISKLSIKQVFCPSKKSGRGWFEAVHGVSFTLEKGKILGIIGSNGSGKSTILRALAGIFSPDEGAIDLHKNSISLLSIGAGFQPKLTGMENIYLSGLLLGFSEKQIKEKEQEIIEFADIGRFINEPVETYSSGMHSKLAFAVATILETDIILIDEILSVGDVKFQEKSFNRMKELINREDRTVVIASHVLATIENLCDEVLWIDNGLIKMHGNTGDVVKAYKAFWNLMIHNYQEVSPEFQN